MSASSASSEPRVADPRITEIQKEFGSSRPRRQRYADLVIGREGWGPLLAYELVVTLSAWVPGALGLFLRSQLYPLILGGVGRNVAFGTNVVLRYPHKIHIGNNVVVDDNCCLDAKGTTNQGIVLGDGVFVGRNTMLSCKNGNITLAEDANIGVNVKITSAADVRVGARTLIAAYTYLIGGDHLFDRVDVPVLHQGKTAKGIDVGDNVWLGAHVVVTDGVRIGQDAVVGAGAVVIDDVPEFHIAAGVPARVVRDRRAAAPPV